MAGQGVDRQPKPDNSILPSMLKVTNDGRPSDATYYTVGFDINQYQNRPNSQAGTAHWGAVPLGAYQGSL
jgi:hypothetical protein